jgi:hypothetical protein
MPSQYWSSAVEGLIIMCVSPKTWNITREPFHAEQRLTKKIPKEAIASFLMKRKQLIASFGIASFGIASFGIASFGIASFDFGDSPPESSNRRA